MIDQKLLIALCLFILALVLPADWHVRGTLCVPGGYRYGHNVPDTEIAYEWWFGEKRMSFTSMGWRFDFGGYMDARFVVDMEKQRLLALNLSNRTFVEIPLPMQLSVHIDSPTASWLDQFAIDGQVVKTGKTAAVLGRKCEEYDVHEWMVRKDDRFFDRRRVVLASPDVPFDWRLAEYLYLWFASFIHTQPPYIPEMKKITGFILSSRESVFEGGSEVKFSSAVTEIARESAPAEAYQAPPHYTRREKLSIDDLFNMRAIAYLYSLY